MLKHIVLFKLKDPTAETFAAAKQMLLSMKGRVKEIIDIEVGIDLLHTERSYDIALSVTLQDLAALAAYQKDAYHDGEVRQYMRSIAQSSVIADYEM